MINDLNDAELCEHYRKMKRNFELVNHIWAQGGNKALFLVSQNILNATTDFQQRLNQLQPKGKP